MEGDIDRLTVMLPDTVEAVGVTTPKVEYSAIETPIFNLKLNIEP